MNVPVFKLEEYLAQHEFNAPFLLCCSDTETFSMKEIIAMAHPGDRALWDNLSLGYTESKGLPLLREAIRKNLYPKLISNQQILTFAGAEEGIFCAFFSLIEPSDEVIVLTPCYQSLSEIPKLRGARVTEVALREENQWRIDIDDIKRAIRPTTKLLVMNFPHNPTGQVVDEEELLRIVELCRQHDLWLFSDEVYQLLGTPQRGVVTPAAVAYEKALSLSVMSKSFGMAGLRIGWLACQDKELLAKIEQMKHYTSICSSGPSEIISLIALNHKERILARNNEIVAANLESIDKFIDENNTLFDWVRPQGGCVGFVHYKGRDSVDQFCDTLLKKKGVLLMPASVYDVRSNHFRIGFGRKNMPMALNALGEFLHS